MRGGAANILRQALPDLSPARAKVMAVVLLHLLKGVVSIANEEAAARAMLMAEIRELVRLYLVSASGKRAQ